jgi:hypothetical protein
LSLIEPQLTRRNNATKSSTKVVSAPKEKLAIQGIEAEKAENRTTGHKKVNTVQEYQINLIPLDGGEFLNNHCLFSTNFATVGFTNN